MFTCTRGGCAIRGLSVAHVDTLLTKVQTCDSSSDVVVSFVVTVITTTSIEILVIFCDDTMTS